jgi:hypothetical protein
MSLTNNRANSFNIEHIGWKYYNSIRKKAMEQEFSWSGLLTSLSIDFFVIIISASALNYINRTMISDTARQQSANKIYFLESSIYLSNNINQTINQVLI